MEATVVVPVVTSVRGGCCVVYDNLIDVNKHNNVTVYLQQQQRADYTK